MTNQRLILETLLESPKTTGEIAKVLGKIDKNGNGKYNVVADDLKKLKTLCFISSKIEKQKGARGPSPTVYNIIYDVKTIINILNSHNSLLTSLQKNDKIIDLIIEKQKENIICDFETPVSILKDIVSPICNRDITQSELQNIQEEIKKKINNALTDDFIKKTKLSPTFFKFFLVNNTHKTFNVLTNSCIITNEESKLYNNFSCILQENVDYIEFFIKEFQTKSDFLFKACINTDIIEDVFNQKSLDFIINKIGPSKSERKKRYLNTLTKNTSFKNS